MALSFPTAVGIRRTEAVVRTPWSGRGMPSLRFTGTPARGLVRTKGSGLRLRLLSGKSAWSFRSARFVDVLHQGHQVGKLRELFRFREVC